MDKKKKVDNVEEFTSERVKKERTDAKANIARAQGTKKEEEGQ